VFVYTFKLNKPEFDISTVFASPQPLSKGEGLRKYAFCFEVLSFGEDLGEAKRIS